jgi:hypothetical protein
VSDADPPGGPRRSLAADDDVAAAVDAVVPGSGGLEDLAGILERPTLDQTGRVQAAIRAVRPDVEVALARVTDLLAEIEDGAQIGAAVVLEISPRLRSADFALGLVRAEAQVDIAQVIEGLIERRPGDTSGSRTSKLMAVPMICSTLRNPKSGTVPDSGASRSICSRPPVMPALWCCVRNGFDN